MRNVADIIKNTNSTFEYKQNDPGLNDPNPISHINDFVLLKLDFSLDFNDDNIKPACLPNITDIGLDFTNDRCFASGWGTLQSSKSS